MARVLHDGRPVGVAFLLPDRPLLTCAHVVASTAGLPDDKALPDRLPVTLDFPRTPLPKDERDYVRTAAVPNEIGDRAVTIKVCLWRDDPYLERCTAKL
ncbi:hypothetical protein ACGFMO_25735 [Streptomyces niveus]|uniref:hypothetical protein n=1 Tax=Streptomyces niveus TaxID=193462 RepID=UPI0037247169